CSATTSVPTWRPGSRCSTRPGRSSPGVASCTTADMRWRLSRLPVVRGSGAAGESPLDRGEDEHRNGPAGPLHVLRVVRPRLDRPLPPGVPLPTVHLAGLVVLLRRPVLQLDVRVGDQVVVPD